ncbi:hypothetical protein FOA52_012321 [Chlamydomonas sp. UWO 241]|nr:hypothetical protein FOA52_012321 [Chlamydomonas sp. UWO 241]
MASLQARLPGVGVRSVIGSERRMAYSHAPGRKLHVVAKASSTAGAPMPLAALIAAAPASMALLLSAGAFAVAPRHAHAAAPAAPAAAPTVAPKAFDAAALQQQVVQFTSSTVRDVGIGRLVAYAVCVFVVFKLVQGAVAVSEPLAAAPKSAGGGAKPAKPASGPPAAPSLAASAAAPSPPAGKPAADLKPWEIRRTPLSDITPPAASESLGGDLPSALGSAPPAPTPPPAAVAAPAAAAVAVAAAPAAAAAAAPEAHPANGAADPQQYKHLVKEYTSLVDVHAASEAEAAAVAAYIAVAPAAALEGMGILTETAGTQPVTHAARASSAARAAAEALSFAFTAPAAKPAATGKPSGAPANKELRQAPSLTRDGAILFQFN